MKTRDRFFDKVKANPIPTAMVGVGLWLLMHDSSDDSETRFAEYASDGDRYGAGSGASYGSSSYDRTSYGSYGTTDRGRSDSNDLKQARDKFGDVVDSAKDKASHLMDSAREKAHDLGDSASHLVDEAGEKASRLGQSASQQMRQVGFEARDLMNESPLILGAAAIVIGALLGAAIPETDKENELMGETRDHLKDKATSVAREGLDKAKDLAGAAAGAAKDMIRDTAAPDSQARPSEAGFGSTAPSASTGSSFGSAGTPGSIPGGRTS